MTRGRDEPLRIELTPHRETIVLAAHGEIDILTAGTLRSELAELLRKGFARVVLDLRGVAFIDSTGLRVILEADRAGREADVVFELIAGPPAVQRLFDLTGTAALLRFIDIRGLDARGL